MLDYMLRFKADGRGWITPGGVDGERALCPVDAKRWPFPNIWLGVSVENQETSDARIPLLLQTPAAVRFVSYEPALGPVNFTRIKNGAHLRAFMRKFATETGRDPDQVEKECAIDNTPWINALTGEWFDGWDSGDDGQKLDWVIVGGESGHGARPFDIQWARDTVAQCRAAGVACFVKQLGAKVVSENSSYGRGYWTQDGDVMGPVFANKKGGNMSEWPADLRVREFPVSSTNRNQHLQGSRVSEPSTETSTSQKGDQN